MGCGGQPAIERSRNSKPSSSQLQGANLFGARLQGADVKASQLQGASLSEAKLHGANLAGAQLQGANFGGAQLLGASLERAHLKATILSETNLWRSLGAGARLSDLSMNRWNERWKPLQPPAIRGNLPLPWDQRDFEALRKDLGAIPAGKLRKEALERIQALDCQDSPRPSCDPDNALRPGSEHVAWRKQMECAVVADDVFRSSLAMTLRELAC